MTGPWDIDPRAGYDFGKVALPIASPTAVKLLNNRPGRRYLRISADTGVAAYLSTTSVISASDAAYAAAAGQLDFHLRYSEAGPLVESEWWAFIPAGAAVVFAFEVYLLRPAPVAVVPAIPARPAARPSARPPAGAAVSSNAQKLRELIAKLRG